MDPVAQGQQPAAETPNQQTQQSNQQAQTEGTPPGLQARIDELTAKRHAAERQAQDAMAQNQILLQQLMEANRQPVPAQPQVDVDPELKKQMDAIMGPQIAEMRRMTAQYAQVVTLQQVDAQAPDAKVAAKAKDIIMQERRAGRDVSADVAVTFALGLMAREQMTTQQAANQQRQTFNAGAGSTISGSGGAPNLAPVQSRPADFDRWSAPQQEKFLSERGVGDLPL